MRENLEAQVQDAIEKQGKIWAKALFLVILQTVSITAFAFTLRADVTRNAEQLKSAERRFERIEADQRQLIRVVVMVETIQKQITEIAEKVALIK